MIGMIVFGLLAISVRLIQSETGLLLVILVVCVFMTFLLYVQKENYQLSEEQQIELLNEQTEISLKTLLDKMPVGVIKLIQQQVKSIGIILILNWFLAIKKPVILILKLSLI